MKKIYFLIFMLASTLAFAQNAPINYEAGGNGATWTWTSFENGGNAPLQIIANPFPTGINTSATVAKLTPLIVGQPWAGVESSHGAGIGTFTLSAANAIVKIMVYKSVISDVGIKFATSTNGSTGEIKVANTLINQWEELTFNFAGKIGEVNDQIAIFPDFQTRTTDNICYFDNLSFSAMPLPTGPAAAAPTPTKLAADVISMYSNAYTNITVDTWRTSWSNATLLDTQIVGNSTKRYSALDFVGIETVGPNVINATLMSHFNIDVWTANVTTFKVKLVDFGADGTFAGGDDKEHELAFTPTLAGWNTFSIPMTDFVNLTTRAHIAQLILVGQPAGQGTVYIDNVYFNKSAPIASLNPIDFETGITGAAWTWTSFENGANAPLQILANPFSSGGNTSATVAKLTPLIIGQPWAGCETLHGADLGTFTFNATNAIVKIMVYKSVISDVGIKFAAANGASSGELKVPNTLINQWEELTFNFSSKIGETNDQIVIFPDFQARTTDNICYFDNITFSAVPVILDPTVAAPTPTVPAVDVISMFSNAYTNVTVDTWRTSWSNATLTDLQVAGNDAKKYAALDFVGIEMVGANTVNATDMSHFHIDVWTANINTFKVKLVDFGADGAFGGGDDKEHEVSLTPLKSTWNSFDIPFTDFVNLTTRGHLAQLILVGVPSGLGTAYVDNIYFRKTNINTTVLPIDYEANGTGATWAWTSFENGANAPLQVVANPFPTGANTSLTVAKLTPLIVGQPWAGVESAHGAGLGVFTFTPANAIVKIMVYKSVLSDVGIKFAAANGASTGELKVANTKINEWEELTFDFSGKIGETNDQIVIFPDFQARSTDNICYFDNISFSNGVVILPEPLVAAPTPLKPASDVISMFSNAYTNVGVDTWRTGWSNATLTEMQVAGNDVKKYSSLDFVGIETTGANLINASTMVHFNLDVWTPNVTTLKVKLVDFGADAAFGGGDDKEHELSLTPTLVGWNTFSIPLADFTGLTTTSHMAQLILAGLPTGAGIIYIDNVYFSKPPVGINNTKYASVKIYPNPTQDFLSIEGLTNTSSSEVMVYTCQGKLISTTEIIGAGKIDVSQLPIGIYILKVGEFAKQIVKY